MKITNIYNILLATGFVFAFGATQIASAAIITSSLGNTASGFNDGDTPVSSLVGDAQDGQLAPFNQNCGGDLFTNCSATWDFSYGAISDTILSASLTIGIVDHDSAASGSQLDSYDVDGNDLRAELDSMFEALGDGLDNMYNVYTIDFTPGLFASLIDGTASVSLALQGPGLQTCTLFFSCPNETLPFVSETTFNGAILLFSTLTIETEDAQTVPEPGSLVLASLGFLLLGIIYRRREFQGV